jgi:hypothetical protein
VNNVNIACKDRERIFRDGTEAEWLALEAHALNCAECAPELESWKSLSAAARELRDYSESGAAWQRIEAALVDQAGRKTRYTNWWALLTVWKNVPALAAAALIVILTSYGSWMYLRDRTTPPVANQSLLKGHAMKEVERTESAYVEAINKLAVETKGQSETDASGLMASYREKLQLLDSAIDDLREQAGRNPSNSHLRYQLLAMYQEKQRTLEEILEEKR